MDEHINAAIESLMLLLGSKQSFEADLKIISASVEESKNWLNKQPDYVNFLRHLQELMHTKNIGIFNELLSHLTKEVLQKEKPISLDLYTHHNLPALNVTSVNNGNKEDIYQGNGGSIANIVSTGLRLIALSRLKKRKFIILDEADCWIEVENVPRFAKIIGQLSQKLEIQTVIISHHSWKFFQSYGKVVEIIKDGPIVSAQTIYDNGLPLEPLTEKNYISSITINRFMSHYETKIDLHPYMTCIVGANDIGKSAIAAAIRAVAYGDSNDRYIQHGENDASVLVELSDGSQILWKRVLKTDEQNPQKVRYSLWMNKEEVCAEYDSNSVPDFVDKVLNISMTEDVDVHIGHQKQPIFLLSNDTKPSQRAKILSLGRESLMVQKMMEHIKDKTRELRGVVRVGEKKFAELTKKTILLENVEELLHIAKEIKLHLIEAEAETKLIGEGKSAAHQMKVVSDIVGLGQINEMGDIPELFNVTQMGEYVASLASVMEMAMVEMISASSDDQSVESFESAIKLLEEVRLMEEMRGIAHLSKIEIDQRGITHASDGDYVYQEVPQVAADIDALSSLFKKANATPIVFERTNALALMGGVEASFIEGDGFDFQQYKTTKKVSLVDRVNVEELDEFLIDQRQEDLSELLKDISFLVAYRREVNELVLLLDKNKEETRKESEQMKALMEEMGNVCPTCSSQIDSDNIMNMGHSHE